MITRYFVMTREKEQPATIIMIEMPCYADMVSLQRHINTKLFERPQTLQCSTSYKMDEEDMEDLMDTIIQRFDGAIGVDFFQYQEAKTRFI